MATLSSLVARWWKRFGTSDDFWSFEMRICWVSLNPSSKTESLHHQWTRCRQSEVELNMTGSLAKICMLSLLWGYEPGFRAQKEKLKQVTNSHREHFVLSPSREKKKITFKLNFEFLIWLWERNLPCKFLNYGSVTNADNQKRNSPVVYGLSKYCM